MCAGMSSGPSTVCVQYGASSGTAASNQEAKSSRTSGEAFSFRVSEADVWRMCRWARPIRTSSSSGTPSTTSRVTRWNPRGRGRSSIRRWRHISPGSLAARMSTRSPRNGIPSASSSARCRAPLASDPSARTIRNHGTSASPQCASTVPAKRGAPGDTSP